MNARRLLSLLAVLACLAVGGVGSVGAPAALAAGDVNQGACPNEGNTGFSPALPDCRAFEQVSPPFKNGFGMGFVRQLAGGDRVEASSLGLVAGATTSVACFENWYDLARGEGGWVTEPVGDIPPQLEYAGSTGCPAYIGESGETLLQLHPAGGSIYERDLYVHEADGSFVEVGPMLPPTAVPPAPTGSLEQTSVGTKAFVATTPDLSHVLYELQPLRMGEGELPAGATSELWPSDGTLLTGDASNLASLYEYVGRDNESPELVGVDNEGHQISVCGTFAGGASGESITGMPGNHHNALSASGETVFFTAVGAGYPECGSGPGRPGVDELFARLRGAETVSISEPQAISPVVPQRGCETGECQANTSKANELTDWRDANFEGASADGTKAFFTSTQQLLDGAGEDPEQGDSAVETDTRTRGCRRTTGRNGCNLYEYDFEVNPASGLPVGLVLVSGGGSDPRVQGVAAVSEDGSHVYFVAKGVLTATANQYGDSAVEGDDNLYVYNTLTRATAFVGALEEADAGQWLSEGGGFGGGEEPMNVTDDGRFLVFTSVAHLTPGDTGSTTQVFRYDALTGELARVSVGEEGYNNNGNSHQGEASVVHAGDPRFEEMASDAHPAVSDNGEIVVFSSTVALTPEAVNNKCVVGVNDGKCEGFAFNEYEYEDGHVYLITGDKASGGEASVSPSGRDVFFTTSQSLVPQDRDTLEDIYDARIDGGFPATGASGCKGEGCQGPSGPAPAFGQPGSASFGGAANPTSPSIPAVVKSKPKARAKACKRGYVKKRGRCVKKPHVKKSAKGRR